MSVCLSRTHNFLQKKQATKAFAGLPYVLYFYKCTIQTLLMFYSYYNFLNVLYISKMFYIYFVLYFLQNPNRTKFLLLLLVLLLCKPQYHENHLSLPKLQQTCTYQSFGKHVLITRGQNFPPHSRLKFWCSIFLT